jgi:carbamate kinase
MIGYLLEQELGNLLPAGRPMATILTRVAVDPLDPAFVHPTKPIGPVYDREEAERHAVEKSWTIAPDGARWRRVVPSPQPTAILEIGVIELLVREKVIVVCAGGGGIPVEAAPDGGYVGIEAVIDKDFAGALLATSLHADAFLMLTDVDAVYADWGTPQAGAIRNASPDWLAKRTFASGSMAPKVEAACRFVRANSGFAAIGSLADASRMLAGEAGTIVTREGIGLRRPQAVGSTAGWRRGRRGSGAAPRRSLSVEGGMSCSSGRSRMSVMTRMGSTFAFSLNLKTTREASRSMLSTPNASASTRTRP